MEGEGEANQNWFVHALGYPLGLCFYSLQKFTIFSLFFLFETTRVKRLRNTFPQTKSLQQMTATNMRKVVTSAQPFLPNGTWTFFFLYQVSLGNEVSYSKCVMVKDKKSGSKNFLSFALDNTVSPASFLF